MFVSFEGIDGCGKTTQLQRLAVWLRAQNREVEVVTTREPGGTRLAESIRESLLHGRDGVSPRAELLLFGAARAQHTLEIIRPALDRGAIVFSDRFSDSTLAYQGGGLDLDAAFIRALNAFATEHLAPDLTFWFDVPLEIALQRRGREKADRIEARGMEFQKRVQDSYAELAANEPWRIARIEAGGTPDEVFELVQGEWQNRVESKRP